MLERLDAFGTMTVGVHGVTTDRFCLVPGETKLRIRERLETVLQVPCIPLEVSFKRLIGVMVACNSNGILLPNHVHPNDEAIISKALEALPGPPVKVHVLEESKPNALGNLIAANDTGAIASIKIPETAMPSLESTLGVNVIQGKIANSSLVGTKIVANSKGVLVTPLASDEEANDIKVLFGVANVDFTTVCLGIEAIKVGMIANSHGAIVGNATSGPEMARISDVLEI
nr:translation initiation factor IF-6 [Candidatus Sigynarchaeota archaeon]